MEIGKYKLEVKDGIIKITPEAPFYYGVAESIANEIAESGTSEWHEVCLKVINELDSHSKYLKSLILQNVQFGAGFYPVSQETIKGRKFEEAKAYVEGYTEAVNHFRPLFSHSENNLKGVLEKLLPSHTA